MMPLFDKKISLIKSKKYVIYVKKDLVLMMIIKSIIKVKDHCHYTGNSRITAHSFCNLRYKTQNKIPLVFHNGSRYDYHSIIKNLAKVLEVNLKA